MKDWAEDSKITMLKPYKGFKIVKREVFNDWGKSVSYDAYKEVAGYVKDYIGDCGSLKKLKEEIRYLVD